MDWGAVIGGGHCMCRLLAGCRLAWGWALGVGGVGVGCFLALRLVAGCLGLALVFGLGGAPRVGGEGGELVCGAGLSFYGV